MEEVLDDSKGLFILLDVIVVLYLKVVLSEYGLKSLWVRWIESLWLFQNSPSLTSS